MGPGEPRDIGHGGGSWRFFGTEVMHYLGPRFEVRYFCKEDIGLGDAGPFGWADLVVVVKLYKCIPRLPRRRPIVFIPLDTFSSPEEVQSDIALDAVSRSAAVIVSNTNLLDHIKHRRMYYIDHHYLDAYEGPRVFDPKAPVLWVAVGDYAPLLTGWCKLHGLPTNRLICITNGAGRREIMAANLGDRVFITKWRSYESAKYAGECGFALDFKDKSFHHRTKPHTKAGFYLASGLPVAMPARHPSRRFLETRFKIEPPVPEDELTWFSEAYWSKIQAVREQARKELSVQTVSANLGDILAGVLKACG